MSFALTQLAASGLVPGLPYVGARRAPVLPGISPYDVAGLSLAYDLLQPGAVTFDGSNRVELLKNFSPTANADAAQALNSLKPLYEAAGLNGKPCIKADGIDDYMAIGAGFLPATKNITGFTVIRVGQWVSVSGTPFMFFISGGGPSTSFRIAEGVVTGPLAAHRLRPIDGGSAENPNFGAPSGSPIVASRDANFSTQAPRAWDSGSPLTVTGSAPLGPTSNTDALLAHLFASGTPSAFANARLGALYFWPRILTTEERQGVETRLGALWGVTITH